jgi:hypothetical protein
MLTCCLVSCAFPSVDVVCEDRKRREAEEARGRYSDLMILCTHFNITFYQLHISLDW